MYNIIGSECLAVNIYSLIKYILKIKKVHLQTCQCYS